MQLADRLTWLISILWIAAIARVIGLVTGDLLISLIRTIAPRRHTMITTLAELAEALGIDLAELTDHAYTLTLFPGHYVIHISDQYDGSHLAAMATWAETHLIDPKVTSREITQDTPVPSLGLEITGQYTDTTAITLTAWHYNTSRVQAVAYHLGLAEQLTVAGVRTVADALYAERGTNGTGAPADIPTPATTTDDDPTVIVHAAALDAAESAA